MQAIPILCSSSIPGPSPGPVGGEEDQESGVHKLPPGGETQWQSPCTGARAQKQTPNCLVPWVEKKTRKLWCVGSCRKGNSVAVPWHWKAGPDTGPSLSGPVGGKEDQESEVHRLPPGREALWQSPGTGLVGGEEDQSYHEFYQTNSGPLEEQQGFMTAEPPLQP